MKLEGVVLRLSDEPDEHGDIMNRDCEIIWKNPVIVNNNYRTELKEVLGRANLKRLEGKGIIGDVVIENLGHPIFEEIGDIFPAVGGKILERKGNVIQKIEITQIAFVEKNVDPKIGPMKILNDSN